MELIDARLKRGNQAPVRRSVGLARANRRMKQANMQLVAGVLASPPAGHFFFFAVGDAKVTEGARTKFRQNLGFYVEADAQRHALCVKGKTCDRCTRNKIWRGEGMVQAW